MIAARLHAYCEALKLDEMDGRRPMVRSTS
jgi:hypothetical protein